MTENQTSQRTPNLSGAVDIAVNTVPSDYSPGRHPLIILLWFLVQSFLFNLAPRPFYRWRRFWLVLFGARIGANVRVRPHVVVEFPWRLEVGENTSIGDHAWIYNLAPIRIGSNCVVSQYAKLVTGSHDVSSPVFELKTAPVVLEDNSWVGAAAFVGPGVTLGEGAVLAACAGAFKDLEPWKIYGGSGATYIKDRCLKSANSAPKE